MFFYLQAALAGLGILCLLLGTLRLGNGINRPIVSAIGAVLVVPFLLCNFLLFYSTLTNGYKNNVTVRPWERVETEKLDMSVIEPAITGLALLLAGGLVVLGFNMAQTPPYPTDMPLTTEYREEREPPTTEVFDPELPDFADPKPKTDPPPAPKPRDGITTSRPAVMVMAGPPSKPTGNAVDPSEWDRAMGQLNAALEDVAQRRRDSST